MRENGTCVKDKLIWYYDMRENETCVKDKLIKYYDMRETCVKDILI